MRLFVAATSVVTMSVLLIFASNTPPSGTAVPRSGKQQLWIKIVFGVDEQSAQWDGRLRITDGRILDSEPYCLERRDRLTGPSRGDNASSELSWTITSELEQTRKATFAVPTRGFLAKLDVTDDSQLHVTTQQGGFRVSVGSLKPGRPQAVLNGRATVERLGTSDLAWETESDDDFTTIDGILIPMPSVSVQVAVRGTIMK